MLQRSSKIIHPSGDVLETPLLVPSFSSKGFQYRKNSRTKKMESEVRDLLKANSEALTDTLLVSAYDINNQFIPVPPAKGINYFPRFTFIDSGGYETSEGYDFSEVYKFPVSAKKWSVKSYQKILNSWPKRFSAIMVSYDNGAEKVKSLKDQISEAKELFKKNNDFIHDFLIKPSMKNGYLKIEEIISNVSLLSGIGIIGFTEKELGKSIGERAKNISLIRKALDEEKITSPLHIFGSLDPITSAVYFLAGAEIFDGLTWLRYGYLDGSAIYQQNYAAIKYGVNENDIVARDLTSRMNLVYLRNLQSEMKQYAVTGNIEVFQYNRAVFKKAIDFLQTIK